MNYCQKKVLRTANSQFVRYGDTFVCGPKKFERSTNDTNCDWKTVFENVLNTSNNILFTVTCKNLETPPFEYISYAQAQAAASRAPVVACGRKYW